MFYLNQFYKILYIFSFHSYLLQNTSLRDFSYFLDLAHSFMIDFDKNLYKWKQYMKTRLFHFMKCDLKGHWRPNKVTFLFKNKFCMNVNIMNANLTLNEVWPQKSWRSFEIFSTINPITTLYDALMNSLKLCKISQPYKN